MERESIRFRAPSPASGAPLTFPASDPPEADVSEDAASKTVELLRNVAIFVGLDDAELARVAELCRERRFESGEHIFREGDPGNRLYLISSGEVRISRHIPGAGEEALAILKPGSVFGEMAVFDRSERSTDAISNGGTTVLTISRSDLELLFELDREIAVKVLTAVVRLLSLRLRNANDQMRSILAMSMF